MQQSSISFLAPTREADRIHDDSQESTEDFTEAARDTTSADIVQYDIAFSPSKRRKLSVVQNAGITSPTHLRAPASTPSRLVQDARVSRLTDESMTRSTQLETFTQAPTSTSRPRFLLPQPSQRATEPLEPLPDAFSPHRRGRKHIAGGMAETMQSWIMEVSHSIQRGLPSIHASWGESTLPAPSHARFEIVDLDRSQKELQSYYAVNAADIDGALGRGGEQIGNVMNVLLVAGDTRHRSKSNQLCRGAVVEIKTPYWDVQLNGRMWLVAVDWKLTS